MQSSAYIDPNNSGMIKDSLATALREEILNGTLVPGERIVEGKWAARLGVAQASVREALNILVSEGFVEKGSGRSAVVIRLTDDDVTMIYEMRAVLEGLAARLVAEKKPDLSDLNQVLADMRSAADCQNIRAFYERDVMFHMLLCEKSGNRFLVQALRRLIVPLFAFVVVKVHAADPEYWLKSIEQHRLVIEALRSGDPFFAQNQAIRTIQKFGSVTCKLLVEQNGESR